MNARAFKPIARASNPKARDFASNARVANLKARAPAAKARGFNTKARAMMSDARASVMQVLKLVVDQSAHATAIYLRFGAPRTMMAPSPTASTLPSGSGQILPMPRERFSPKAKCPTCDGTRDETSTTTTWAPLT